MLLLVSCTIFIIIYIWKVKSCVYIADCIKVKVTLRLTVGQSVSLSVETHLGLMTRYLLLFDSYGLVFVGRLYRLGMDHPQKTHQLLSNGYHEFLSGVFTHALPSNGRPIVVHSLL
jgi:hypothetical protein